MRRLAVGTMEMVELGTENERGEQRKYRNWDVAEVW
jgi:hypothetical protein